MENTKIIANGKERLPGLIILALGVWMNSAQSGELSIPDENRYDVFDFTGVDLGKEGFRYSVIPASWEEINLNGNWKLKKLAGTDTVENNLEDEGLKTGFYKPEYDDSSWTNQVVPRSWHEEGSFDGVGWYRKAVDIPETWKNRRVILEFYGVCWQADAWINGKKFGERHIGARNPFEIDITEAIKPGGKNVIAVRVFTHYGKSLSSYAHKNMGGIWEPVRLISVPSPVYARRVLITPRLDKAQLEVEAWLENREAAKKEMELFANAAGWKGEDKGYKTSLGKVSLEPGLNKKELIVPAQDLKLWEPGNPYLYVLTLSDNQGREISAARFGYREFKARDKRFYLNGKRIYLSIQSFNVYTIFLPRDSGPDGVNKMKRNTDNFLAELIYGLRTANKNMIRIHEWQGRYTLYDLCDELGMMIYDEGYFAHIKDWYGIDDPNEGRAMAMEKSKGEEQERVYTLYNHPSVVMWNFGNEIYEGHSGHFSEVLTEYYDLVKSIDKQDRPITSSSGRLNKESMHICREKTDVYDDHQYRGLGTMSWQENIGHIKEYREAMKQREKGPDTKPAICCEFGSGGDFRHFYWNNEINEIKKIWDGDTVDKEAYIKLVTSPKPEGIWTRFGVNAASAKTFWSDEKKAKNELAERYEKRMTECYRRAGFDLVTGESSNLQWYEILPWWTIARRDRVAGFDIGLPKGECKFIKTPFYYQLKRVYNPVLVSLDETFDKNIFAGEELKLELYVINGADEDREFTGLIQIRDKEGKVIKQETFYEGLVKGFSLKTVPYNYKTAGTLATGFYRIELYLFSKDKRISDNYYNCFVLGDKDNIKKIETRHKLALYDQTAMVFGGLGLASTRTILDKLSIPYTSINDFKDLDKYDLLIIGANSIDKNIIDNGGRIREWVEKGGRLLSFEQSFCGSLPWLSEAKVAMGYGSHFTDILVPAHPAFIGLSQDNFDTWNGKKGYLFKYGLAPLGKTLISTSKGLGGYDGAATMHMILSDAALGKGEAITSQYLATERYGKDSVATKYVQNLLAYLLHSDWQKFAMPIEGEKGKKAIYLEDRAAYFVDITKQVNRGFHDETAGDKKGGWADFGEHDMRDIPPGAQRFQGGVPFKIIDPAQNNGNACIVLKGVAVKGAERGYFPGEALGIPVNKKLDSLYFLHTSMYTVGDVIYKVVVHYKNGEKRELLMRNKVDLADWYMPADLPNATVVWKNRFSEGLFMSSWLNPMSDIEIESMDLISENKTIPAIIAITGKRKEKANLWVDAPEYE